MTYKCADRQKLKAGREETTIKCSARGKWNNIEDRCAGLKDVFHAITDVKLFYLSSQSVVVPFRCWTMLRSSPSIMRKEDPLC
jgi:hypothetical protein